MPDGSLYAIIRNQGRFSTKFQLADYPFDTQFLTVAMEDTIASEDTQIYVPDPSGSLGLDPEITLPGFKVGKPEMRIVSNTYPTNFGASDPVARPLMAMSVKTFVPIVLIVICAALVFFVRPHYVEGRIGLGITALLTLVALQHVERHAPRCRLFDDARQDLSPRLRVHHRGIGAGGLDVMARGG
jgi:hypothetical protein